MPKNPFNKLTVPLRAELAELGVTIHNLELLKQALTRQSAIEEQHPLAAKQSYQGLEFFGDRVLAFTAASIIMEMGVVETAEDLNRIFTVVTANHILAKVGKQLHLERYIICGEGETEVTDKMYADAVEAILGTVSLDTKKALHGFRKVKPLVARLFTPYIRETIQRQRGIKPLLEDIFNLREIQVTRLLELGYNPHQPIKQQYSTTDRTYIRHLSLLHYAARHNQREAVIAILDRGVHIDLRDNFGRTALATASDHGHREFVQLLLEHGADPEVADNGNWRPLHLAIYIRNEDIVRDLLARNVTATTRCDNGTPLEIAKDKGNTVIKALLETYLQEIDTRPAPRGAPAEIHNITIVHTPPPAEEPRRCLEFVAEQGVKYLVARHRFQKLATDSEAVLHEQTQIIVADTSYIKYHIAKRAQERGTGFDALAILTTLNQKFGLYFKEQGDEDALRRSSAAAGTAASIERYGMRAGGGGAGAGPRETPERRGPRPTSPSPAGGGGGGR